MNIDLKKIKKSFCHQSTQSSCGLACLISIAKYYGKKINEEQLKTCSGTTTEGTSLLGLKEASNVIGFESDGYEADIDSLKGSSNLLILHTISDQGFAHYVVYYGYDPSSDKFVIGDPATGIQKYTEKELSDRWQSKLLLVLSPSPIFLENSYPPKEERKFFFIDYYPPTVTFYSLLFF